MKDFAVNFLNSCLIISLSLCPVLSYFSLFRAPFIKKYILYDKENDNTYTRLKRMCEYRKLY